MIYFNRLFMLAFQQSDLLLPTFKFELFQLNCQNLHRKDKKILNLKLESFRFSLYFKKSNKLNYPLIFSFLFIYSFRLVATWNLSYSLEAFPIVSETSSLSDQLLVRCWNILKIARALIAVPLLKNEEDFCIRVF